MSVSVSLTDIRRVYESSLDMLRLL